MLSGALRGAEFSYTSRIPSSSNSCSLATVSWAVTFCKEIVIGLANISVPPAGISFCTNVVIARRWMSI